MSSDKLVWHTEKRKLRDLLPTEGNPRQMTKKQAEDLQKSLDRFNLVDIPAINTDNRIRWAGIFGTEKEPDKNKSRIHPTQKPVALATWFLEKFSEKSEIIADLYGGSGSTLIACETMGRRCRVIEAEPIYAEVILRRWEKMNGQTAKKIT